MPRKRRTTDRIYRIQDASGANVSVTSMGEGLRVLLEIEAVGMVNGVLLTHEQVADLAAALYRAARTR